MEPGAWSRDVTIAVPVDPTPLDYGERQRARVAVPWENEVFYYAIVAIDESGNRGPISNVVSAYYYRAPTVSGGKGLRSQKALHRNRNLLVVGIHPRFRLIRY